MDGPDSSAPGSDTWARFQRSGQVTARRLDAPLTWTTRTGERMQAAAGDWLVTDPSGGDRSVVDASFRATHRHLQGDRWERVAAVRARPARPGEIADTPEGRTTAAAGDWRVQDADGVEWFVPDDHFRAVYRRVRGDS